MANVAGTSIELTVDLRHSDHPDWVVAKADYRIVDERGAVIADWTLLTGATLGQTSALVIVPAAANNLAEGQSRAGREIEVVVTTTTGEEYVVSKTYVIIGLGGDLKVGVNTAVNLAGAHLLSQDIFSTPAWDKAQRESRVAALAEAYSRLGRLRFVEGFCGSLGDLQTEQFAALDSKILRAICAAQLLEAEHILANPDEHEEAAGILVDTVGDASRTYKTVRAVKSPLSKRSLAYVSRYVDLSNRLLGRT